MKNQKKRLGLALGIVAVMAIGSTTAAWATVAGVGEVETTIAGPNRAVSATAQYQGTRNANGTRTLVYECAGIAVGDAAATNITCSVSANGVTKATSTLTTPGPASVIANTVTVPGGSIRLCYQATAYWIGGGSNSSLLRCTYVNLDALDMVTTESGSE